MHVYGRWFVMLALAAMVGCLQVDDAEVSDRTEASEAAALVWVGDTHERVGQVWLPPGLQAPAGRELAVYTQTFPVGAASAVELHWLDAGGHHGSVAMVHDADYVGIYGSNAQWRGALPASVMTAGDEIQYWVRAADRHGNVLWDSLDGSNYRVDPRAYEIGWVGGFGSYRPINGDYREGYLFNDDLSTSTGCFTHGVSASSYLERAARVWVPELTDRELDDSELAAAKEILQLELYTDARPEGWTPLAASFARRVGNDFLYSFRFVTFTPVCVPGLDAGTYSFKLRASTDGGARWFWRGTDNGPLGGYDLAVHYAPRCSYFNDPTDCIPE